MGIQIVGHRGASGYAPETTIASYRMALQMGADFVETDVHMSRDGVLISIHDADVSRTTNGKGLVADLTLAELKTLDAGSWFNIAFPDKAHPHFAELRIPTLQEVVDVVKDSPTGLFIEIKDPERYPPDLESDLLSLIRHNRMESRARVLSFHERSLRKTKELDLSMPTVLLVAKPDRNPVHAALDIAADELGILYTQVTASLIEEAHQNGLLISVWTVDRPEDMKRMMILGVDRITTNYPDRLVRMLTEG
jgi:glycerophosphoryl diester phosphodiesterase